MSKDKIHPNWQGVRRPMTATDKRKWLKALRSGEWRKGRGYLRNPQGGGYCCLGVANEIFELGLPTDKGTLWTHDHRQYSIRVLLPREVQDVLAEANDKNAGYAAAIEIIERIEPYKEGD